MRVLSIGLVLLATFVLSVSFAVPAEDVPETPYDESESLPYEITQALSGGPVQESNVAVWSAPRQLISTPGFALCDASCRELPAHLIFDSLVILDHDLRC